ncbi:MAG: outer membrane lipoprotein carrier protein LolA [Cyclobacteriaceae bacterium]|jgi:outer membrane lipoprotein carrier protein|nr:outer membrane lipoprotein carrier protein LolA [Cyclobacteriaceae bacterium]
MIKSIFTLSVCLIFMTQAFPQKDPVALEILDAMSTKYKNIPAFIADFNYIMENEEESIDEKFEGKITVKGGKYKLEVSGQEIINDGVSVWTYSKDDNEVTISEYDDTEEEITLTNIFSIYKEGFKYLYIETQENGKLDIVDLVPDDREKSYFKIRMEIKKPSRELKNFRIFDKSGSKYLYQIKTFAENSIIKDTDFKFDQRRYPGVEIVDFR